jgi:hypothetical protein
MAKYSASMTVKEILADPELKAVVAKHMPMVDEQPGMIAMVENMTLASLKDMIPMPDVKKAVEEALAELETMA